MKLVSAGAARTVTGSCHLVESGGRRLLVDCGMFQGEEVESLNRAPFPFEPGAVDAVLLTHGHLDHVGRLPLLVRRGYAGPVYATRATRAVAEVILLDSAQIQVEEHDRALRRAREAGASAPSALHPGGSERPGPSLGPRGAAAAGAAGSPGAPDEPEGAGQLPDEPLYGPGDALDTLALFREAVLEEPFEPVPGVHVRFRQAGHVLGSAYLVIDTPEGRIVASGDLGNREGALHPDAPPAPGCVAVLVETTYGDRTHRSLEATVAEFAGVLRDAVAGRGIVMIPSFALERTQTVLHHLGRLMRRGEVPAVPVFLDSPMAAKMTRLHQAGMGDFRPPIARALARGEDPFEPPTLRYTVTREQSMRLNGMEGPAVIVAGSGMMSGGRILHHLKHNLWKEQASLVVVGYQAEGTLGRRIVDGASVVRIHRRDVEVRARVATINGFSAHADREDLLAWLEPSGDARALLVHGDPPAMASFQRELASRGREATIVERDRPLELGPE